MNEQVEVQPMTTQPVKKVALAQRRSKEEKLKQDEQELEQLIAEHKGEAQESVKEPEPEVVGEEKTFKKRYGDLRRHMQEKDKEFQGQIDDLKKQLLETTQKEIKLPKSEEDIDAWAKSYPDVAAIVETIAMKKAAEQSASLEQRVKALDDMQQDVSKQRAETELLQMHPDFDDIRNDDDFHAWADEQPKWVQDALYENDNDARSAARAIDLYKADKNLTTKKASNKDAAKSVSTKGKRNKPVENESSSFLRESDVQRMTAKEYESKSDEIMEAIRQNKFVYDLSGSAR